MKSIGKITHNPLDGINLNWNRPHFFFLLTFEFKGCTIPKGWMVIWAIRSTHLDQGVYREPDRFDPDRFSPGRAEQDKHEHAFSPHGPGADVGHKCPGADYASLFMEILTVQLLREFEWELPPQDLEYDWRLTPPEPKDGLRLRRF